jgi:hypothetical protein
LALIAYTPLAMIWFRSVSGLPVELAELAMVPIRIAALLPALTVLMAFQRALLVSARLTRPLTAATVVELGAIAAVLSLGIFRLELIGVVAAIAAVTIGRIAGNVFLVGPCVVAIGRLRRDRVADPAPAAT